MRISDWSSDVCSSDLVSRKKSGYNGVLAKTGLAISFSLFACPALYAQETATEISENMEAAPIEAPTSTDAVPPQEAPTEEAVSSGGVEDIVVRSEEHTSELQSLMRISYAVFCFKTK